MVRHGIVLIALVLGIFFYSHSELFSASCATNTCGAGAWVNCSAENYGSYGCCAPSSQSITCCCQNGTTGGTQHTNYEIKSDLQTCRRITNNCVSQCSGLGGVGTWNLCDGVWTCGSCGPSCTNCTPPACPAGTAESPNTGYSTTTSCDRGEGCSPRYNTRTCYYQRENLCSSAYFPGPTLTKWLKSGESTTVTANANTNVNEFIYIFYNAENSGNVVCSNSYIAGWAQSQGVCAAGKYQLVRANVYATARTSETTTFPANNIFISDANWGGQVAKRLQVNVYFRKNDRPLSLPSGSCVIYPNLCTPLCNPDPSNCASPYTNSWTSFGTKTFTCNNTPADCGIESKTCYCASACTPASCPSDLSNTNQSQGTSSTVTRNCTNNCGHATTLPCYCKDCTNSCYYGTTLTNTGKQSTDPSLRQTSCSRGTGCNPKVESCYCTRCNPPSCLPTYSETNYGYGSVVLSCNNTIVSCGTESRNCYIDKCENCTLPNCPTQLDNTGDNNFVLENFKSCTKGSPCGGPLKYGSCYERPSPQPTASLQIYPDDINKYDFASSTHTGTRVIGQYNLNDPINMTATYTDVNGADDIEAISVWFRNSSITGEVTSPLWIDTDVNPSQPPKSPSNDSWGFMMRKESGVWKPYIPSYPSSGTAKWVRAVPFTDNKFVIAGPNSTRMVEITIGNTVQPNITQSGNNVVLPFRASFHFSEGYEEVAEVSYDVLLMGNDVFSFTPYDNYPFSVASYWQPGQLRYRTSPGPGQLYARQWSSSAHIRTIDKQLPYVSPLNISVVGETQLQVQWDIEDTQRIYAIVGNIYASGSMTEPQPIGISGSGIQVVNPFPLKVHDYDEDLVGKIGSEYAFRKLLVNSPSDTSIVSIDLGENKDGSLLIYLTAFDYSGNMYTRYTSYALGDWVVTDGGFAYSSDGKDFETRDIAEDAWSPSIKTLLGLSPHLVDISTEMWADNRSSGSPQAPLKASDLSSYHLKPFIEFSLKNYHEEFYQAYRKRDIPNKVEVLLEQNNISGNMFGDVCGTTDTSRPCILIRKADLTISDNLVCNGKGLIFVSGDLHIDGYITNSNQQDACIIIVQGDVNINDGPNASGASFGYDIYDAYILSQGSIRIKKEDKHPDERQDGVFVRGGLHSIGDEGIVINRNLKLFDSNLYPTLVVKHHSKYGILSNVFFGSQIDLVRTDQGYKPY